MSLRRKATQRIAPRAENLLRLVNDTILYNVSLGETEIKFELPPRLTKAFMIVNETGTLEVDDFRADVVLQKAQ
jgi:hypothetical protein